MKSVALLMFGLASSIFASAQDAPKAAEVPVSDQKKTYVTPAGDLKPASKASVFKDNMDKDIHTFKPMTPRVYLFEDTTEKRSGYGVWWCSNYLSTRTWPMRAMFLSGLNGEGDYLLYFADPNETRTGSTQRFSPNLFKKNGDVLEKITAEKSPATLKFEPKFKDGEMTTVAFTYTAPNHRDFKYLTRENCEKY